MSDQVKGLFRDALGVLSTSGVILEEAALPPFPYDELAVLFIEAEAASAFEALIRSGRTRELADPSHREKRPADYEPKASAADFVRAMRLRGEVQRICAAFFERFDLVVAPNLPYPAPRVEAPLDDLFQSPDPLGAAGNLAGLPAVALPMGLTGEEKVPVGFQLVGKPFDEARILSVAAAFQAVTRHHRESPPV